MSQRWAFLMLLLLAAGCTSRKPAPYDNARGDVPPTQAAPNAPVSPEKQDIGYLQVLVRSGAQGENPPIPDADVTINETGIQVKTNNAGHSPSIELSAPVPHPAVPSQNIGYYTITVKQPGFKTSIHHGFVHGGKTASNPTTVDIYLVPGDGEVVTSDSPVGGRNGPQTPSPSK